MTNDNPVDLVRIGLESDYQAALTKAQPIGNTDDLDRLFELLIAKAAAADKKELDAAL